MAAYDNDYDNNHHDAEILKAKNSESLSCPDSFFTDYNGKKGEI